MRIIMDMTMKTHNLLLRSLSITLLIGFASFSAPAQSEQDECNPGDTTNVYVINGIDTTKRQTELMRDFIKIAYKNLKKDDEELNFLISHNLSRGLVLDLIEVFRQKVDEFRIDPSISPDSLFWSSLVSTIPFLLPGQAAALRFLFLQSIRNYPSETVSSDVHFQKFNGDLESGKKVFIIPHSQGNLFANSAVARVISEKSSYSNSIGMIGVASPASRRVNNQPYVTANDDTVINNLRLTFSSTLDGNIDNSARSILHRRDETNHRFLISYFEPGLRSRDRIDSAVESAIGTNTEMGTLRFPTAEVGDGAIRVTLRWGSQLDVDLHIYEPDDGSHVYYANKQGGSGVLDRDDTTSFGPENYFVTCDNLQTGTYRVGVNYFAGTGTETAKIQITTGDGRTRNYTRRLTTERGSAGNNSPITVATIVVAKDSNGAYTFTVR